MRKSVATQGLSTPLKGEIITPPDKSMSHRSLIIGSLTKGKIKISNQHEFLCSSLSPAMPVGNANIKVFNWDAESKLYSWNLWASSPEGA